MIIYESASFLSPLTGLTRVHGSAIYSTALLALLSTGILLVYEFAGDQEESTVVHPYAVGAFIAFFSFLLTFRLNTAYQRYWEAATSVYFMLSKWLDCAINMAAFHYQSSQFDDIQPPSFGSFPHLDRHELRGRVERTFQASFKETKQAIDAAAQEQQVMEKRASARQVDEKKIDSVRRRRQAKNTHPSRATHQRRKSVGKRITMTPPKTIDPETGLRRTKSRNMRIPIPQRFRERFTLASVTANNKRPTSRRDDLVKQSRAEMHLEASPESKVPLPSLFLQETAHLVSLLAAVAMSTLRNDIPEAASPLTEYVPGRPWPCVDPDELSDEVKSRYGGQSKFWKWIYFCLGLSRSERHRTLYNAARPFAVLGGVSDSEIDLLQAARGPYAKLSLCTMWLQEFLSREYLHGSTGNVADPIISRLYQFISDGVSGYNQARKVAYIPFPFPNAQTSAFFSFVIIFIFPLLFRGFVDSLGFACVLNFTTVLCFLGMHEVARELENPFQNVPNDIPLTTLQAQFNEALVTMYAGFHPDSWWELQSKATADVAAE